MCVSRKLIDIGFKSITLSNMNIKKSERKEWAAVFKEEQLEQDLSWLGESWI